MLRWSQPPNTCRSVPLGCPYLRAQGGHVWACPYRAREPETSQLLPSRTFHRGENQATPDPSVFAQHIRYFSVFELTLFGTSLVVQGIRIHLAMQETRVRPKVWEDSTCLGVAEPACLESMLRNKRSRHHQKPVIAAKTQRSHNSINE